MKLHFSAAQEHEIQPLCQLWRVPRENLFNGVSAGSRYGAAAYAAEERQRQQSVEAAAKERLDAERGEKSR